MAAHGQTSSTWNDAEAKKLPEKLAEMELSGNSENLERKRIVVVGLGMVGIAFM